VASQQKYCREVKADGKRTYQPYDPQPTPDSLIVVDRYYATLTANDAYKRCVTWLAVNGDGVGSRAVYEYIGQHVASAPHGNTKNSSSAEPFGRMPAATMERVGEILKSNRPQDVYNQLIVNNDAASAPRDSRVVRNAKLATSRMQKAANGHSGCRPFADKVQLVMELIRTDDFIRHIFVHSDCLPNVVLYSDRQISDIKGMCFDRENGSVIGIDKTYNIGSVYVTASVYKNIAIMRKRSGDCPVFIGLLFIHGRSDTVTYSDFFSHLSAKLMGCDFQALTLGSDDELAMRKCIAHFFPRASVIVCSCHLRENMGRKLDELLGKTSDIRRQLMDALFGANGLVHIDNVVSFDSAVDQLRQPTGLLSTCLIEFHNYCNRRLLQLMRDNCAAGRSTWTNNNCESINYVLKQAVQWRGNQLPELIDKLRTLVDGQHADADRALCGRTVAVTSACAHPGPNIVSQWSAGQP